MWPNVVSEFLTVTDGEITMVPMYLVAVGPIFTLTVARGYRLSPSAVRAHCPPANFCAHLSASPLTRKPAILAEVANITDISGMCWLGYRAGD